jgi:acyl-coenzyme A thioesterase PaaI-like protein
MSSVRSPFLEGLQRILRGEGPQDVGLKVTFPPPIATTIGFTVVDVDEGIATMELKTSLERHANPMGTVHGGVLCDLADAAIGTAHATTLAAGHRDRTRDDLGGG